jgi:hypothetical protein
LLADGHSKTLDDGRSHTATLPIHDHDYHLFPIKTWDFMARKTPEYYAQ